MPRTAKLLAVLAGACLMLALPAQAQNALTGGPKGLVKNNKGEPLEGIMVQLIAKKNGIRTTVYSHDDGRYEFPKLDAGTYPLRIARPREFYPFVKEALALGRAVPQAEIKPHRVAR